MFERTSFMCHISCQIFRHEMSTFCCTGKTQNFVIYLVLTVFGVCGAAVLLLLRPVKDEEEGTSEVCCWSFFLATNSFCFLLQGEDCISSTESFSKDKVFITCSFGMFLCLFFRNQPAPLIALSMSITCTVSMLLYYIVFYI